MASTVRTLLHVFPTFEVGGAQMRFTQLANHFGGRYRHVVVSLDGATAARQRLGNDVDAEVLPLRTRDDRTLRKVSCFRRMLRDLRPDLLVTSNWGSMDWTIANLLAHVPHLHMEDGFGPEETDRQLPRRVWARRLLLRRSTVMVPSHNLLRIGSDVWRLPRDRLVHVPNGVNCARFTCEPDLDLAARHGIRRDIPVIGTVGALRSEKNLARLLEAFAVAARTRRVQLVIVGDGPQRGELGRMTASLGLTDQVVFTGALSAPERLLPMFTMFALSSDTEQMPLSVLEAMAASRPIVATDVGDVRDVVAHENRGFIVPRSAGALVNAILKLLEDPERAAQIGKINRERVFAVYDERIMYDAYRRLFDGTPGGCAAS